MRTDYAFWQHILQSLAPKTGRCAILFPHGVLFRQEEADMRRKLIEADAIAYVIGLGPNLFYNSLMEACVVICRTVKAKERRGSDSFSPFQQEQGPYKLLSFQVSSLGRNDAKFQNESLPTEAPGNGSAIGGLKVITANGWFAARPSGTENVYKIYAESFRGPDHLRQIQDAAQALITKVSSANA